MGLVHQGINWKTWQQDRVNMWDLMQGALQGATQSSDMSRLSHGSRSKNPPGAIDIMLKKKAPVSAPVILGSSINVGGQSRGTFLQSSLWHHNEELQTHSQKKLES